MKKMMTVTMALCLSTQLFAKPNVEIDRQAQDGKMKEIAGATSPFNPNERFPKDYFLIPKNLPYSLGLVLHHPESSTLELTEAQLDKLIEIKKKRKPEVIKAAKELKALELQLVKAMTIEGRKASEVSELVDTIAKKKAELTKKHLLCIEQTRDILTPEQREKAKGLMQKKQSRQNDSGKKEAHHKVKELFPLPHPLKVIMANKEALEVTKAQEKRFEEELMAVYPAKIHGALDQAEPIEAKIRKSVLEEHKSKEDLKADIEALIDIKRGLSYDHIDAFNKLEDILTKEQYEKVLVLIDQKKKHKHHKKH